MQVVYIEIKYRKSTQLPQLLGYRPCEVTAQLNNNRFMRRSAPMDTPAL